MTYITITVVHKTHIIDMIFIIFKVVDHIIDISITGKVVHNCNIIDMVVNNSHLIDNGCDEMKLKL